MGRNQRDEPQQASIADATTTQTTDESDHINLCIDALEKAGVKYQPTLPIPDEFIYEALQ